MHVVTAGIASVGGRTQGPVLEMAIVALTRCEGAVSGRGLRMPARVGERFFAPPRYCPSSS